MPLTEWLVTIVLVSAACVLLGRAIRIARFTWTSRAWPIFIGRIVRARVCEVPWGDTGVGYLPKIEYEYWIGNELRSNDVVSFGWIPTDVDTAEHTVERYPPGANVEIYCDPRNPQRCVLEPRLPTQEILFFAMLAAVCVGSALWLIVRHMTN